MTDWEISKYKGIINGMSAEQKLVAITAFPTTIIAGELERRDVDVNSILTNINALLSTINNQTSIDDCYKTFDAIKSICRSKED